MSWSTDGRVREARHTLYRKRRLMARPSFFSRTSELAARYRRQALIALGDGHVDIAAEFDRLASLFEELERSRCQASLRSLVMPFQPPDDTDIARGCLLGGAVGDALGAPAEFLSSAEIEQRFGPEGIRDFQPAYGRIGAITDDTQMTLFTAEGVLRAFTRGNERGVCHGPTIIHHAYLRWLGTQDVNQPTAPCFDEYPGWLIGVRALHHRRAPGSTCLSALRSGMMGSIEDPINDSKGCGGVMRAAPLGLLHDGDPFTLGCEAAAITHGHPSGYITAGCLALTIAQLRSRRPLRAALDAAVDSARSMRGHEETVDALLRAIRLAEESPRSRRALASLGEGWVAEEALAIAVYSALSWPESFEEGVVLAVNHGGDSDSTGAITGNLLGALLGADAIPPRWLGQLELREEIEAIANDLLVQYQPGDAWWDRYPGC